MCIGDRPTPPPSNARIGSPLRVDVVATGAAHEAAGSGTMAGDEPVEPMTDRREATPGAASQGGNDPCALANDRSPSRAAVEFHRHSMTEKSRPGPHAGDLPRTAYQLSIGSGSARKRRPISLSPGRSNVRSAHHDGLTLAMCNRRFACVASLDNGPFSQRSAHWLRRRAPTVRDD